jgi:hypothetical protein
MSAGLLTAAGSAAGTGKTLAFSMAGAATFAGWVGSTGGITEWLAEAETSALRP